jgi:hypothetical protein
MKIILLDVDLVSNKKIESTLASETGLQLLIFSKMEQVVEILNGDPALDIKKVEIEKALADTGVMLKKVLESIEAGQKRLQEKRTLVTQLTDSPAHQAQKPIVAKEIADTEVQLKKADELRTKLEQLTVTRKGDLETLKSKAQTPENKKAHLLLVDRSFLGNSPAAWIDSLRGQITLPENKDIPVVAMGYNESTEYIKQTLVPGIIDYFVKPVDTLLLKHNAMKISGKTLDPAEKVYEIQTQGEIKLLRIAKTMKMSEFELELQSNGSFNPNEVIEFFADVFSDDKGGKLLGRCLKCEPDPNTKGFFIAHFSFVGMSPHAMNEMRKWLRLQYANLKKNG